MDRPGTCIILDKKYNIANSSCHFGSYGSIWTGLSQKKYYMDLRSFGPYKIVLVTDRCIYCHMTLSPMNYLLYIMSVLEVSTYSITSITSYPIKLIAILVIMYICLYLKNCCYSICIIQLWPLEMV